MVLLKPLRRKGTTIIWNTQIFEQKNEFCTYLRGIYLGFSCHLAYNLVSISFALRTS